jgi:putative transcriptional regulator
MASMESLRGQLLIASPVIVDPNFRRTVVLIAEHSEEGAMGVVLNRPSEAKVEEAATPLDALVGPGEPIYAGGPVEPAAVVVLAEFDDPEDAATIVVDRVGFMRSDASVEDVNAHTSRARVFAGYAGWGGGQLEAEIAEGSWYVVDSATSDLFAVDPTGLWAAVLRRQPGELAWMSTRPLDPTVN